MALCTYVYVFEQDHEYLESSTDISHGRCRLLADFEAGRPVSTQINRFHTSLSHSFQLIKNVKSKFLFKLLNDVNLLQRLSQITPETRQPVVKCKAFA